MPPYTRRQIFFVKRGNTVHASRYPQNNRSLNSQISATRGPFLAPFGVLSAPSSLRAFRLSNISLRGFAAASETLTPLNNFLISLKCRGRVGPFLTLRMAFSKSAKNEIHQNAKFLNTRLSGPLPLDLQRNRKVIRRTSM